MLLLQMLLLATAEPTAARERKGEYRGSTRQWRALTASAIGIAIAEVCLTTDQAVGCIVGRHFVQLVGIERRGGGSH